MEALSDLNRMLQRLEPVMEPVSKSMEFRRNFDAVLVDFLIWSKSVKNLLIIMDLMQIVSLNGWIK